MSELTATGYAQVTMRPAWDAWAESLRANVAQQRLTVPLTESQRGELRGAMVALAAASVRETHEIACSLCNLRAPSNRVALLERMEACWTALERQVSHFRSNETPIVMTGHQPTIFHPGIEWKYRATDAFARQSQAIGLAVWMDTDPGDAGSFQVPRSVGPAVAGAFPSLVRSARSLASVGDMMAHCRVQPKENVLGLAREVAADLAACDQLVAAREAQETLELYAELSGGSVIAAHQAVKWFLGRETVPLKVPFSQLMALPLAQRVMFSFVSDAPRLVTSYNSGLDAWRKERGIRNAANPFPNLASDGAWQELPFWILRASDDRRRSLMWRPIDEHHWELRSEEQLLSRFTARPSADELVASLGDVVLLPRGAMISLFYRLYCCDLFVHGTGGGTYDQFTDRFIQEYFGQLPPAFVVASGTRYLFPERLGQLSEWDELSEKSRDVLHHPERYLGRGWFESDVEITLQKWLSDKTRWVQELRDARKEGRSGAEAGRQLESIAAQTKQLIQAILEPRLARLAEVSEATRNTLRERTWPWFYFAD